MIADERKEWLKLAGVALLWFLLTKYLVPLGNAFVPDAWKAMISFQTFRMLCQGITLAAGVGLSFAVLRRPRAALGFTRPSGPHLAATVLLAPAAFVLTSYLALQIAMPTLLFELATKGPGASRQNAGELGRTLTQAPLLVVLLWGAVLAAVGEELLFRGALWSAVERLVALFQPRPSPVFEARSGEGSGENGVAVTGENTSADAVKSAVAGEGAVGVGSPVSEPPPFMQTGRLSVFLRDVLPGTTATLASAIIFGQMHADMQGGVGIVRVASTTILGLVCGLGRQVSGTIGVPILLHVLNNTMTIGSSRRWFVSSPEPILDGIPDALVVVGFLGLLSAAVLFVLWRLWMRRRAGALDGPVPGSDVRR